MAEPAVARGKGGPASARTVAAPARTPEGTVARPPAAAPSGRPAPSHLAAEQVDLLWRFSKRWSAALAVALFPFVFIVDEAVETALSPVLPAILALTLLVVGMPFAFMEGSQRRLRRLEGEARNLRLQRYRQSSRFLLTLAFLWFGAWLALGV